MLDHLIATGNQFLFLALAELTFKNYSIRVLLGSNCNKAFSIPEPGVRRITFTSLTQNFKSSANTNLVAAISNHADRF